MRLSFLAAGVLASAIGAVPLAWSAPGQDRKVTNFKNYQTYVSASSCDTAGYCFYFGMTVYVDSASVPQGYAYLQSYAPGNSLLTDISCEGAAYANIVYDVNMATGTAKANVTLNPASVGCRSFNASTTTMSMTVTKNGSYHYTNVGTGTNETPDSAFTNKTHTEEWGATLSGSITGYSATSFQGTLWDARISDLIKTR